ncbi:unnamed protein product [Hydatigera taeniaeformis]|uniref:Protein kinase domain-containing protein n=1 Tax=Hydatigena taeniaeformis TaxID=6205 RepID=A0A0R3WSE2_HYDTA|nr:unnamed protein product [Hydatigera taeniaeformis]
MYAYKLIAWEPSPITHTQCRGNVLPCGCVRMYAHVHISIVGSTVPSLPKIHARAHPPDPIRVLVAHVHAYGQVNKVTAVESDRLVGAGVYASVRYCAVAATAPLCCFWG